MIWPSGPGILVTVTDHHAESIDQDLEAEQLASGDQAQRLRPAQPVLAGPADSDLIELFRDCRGGSGSSCTSFNDYHLKLIKLWNTTITCCSQNKLPSSESEQW